MRLVWERASLTRPSNATRRRMSTLSHATPRLNTKQHIFVKDFIELHRRVNAQRYIRWRYFYYWVAFICIAAILAGLGVAFVLVTDSWWQLLISGLLAITLNQIAFLSHDAAHMQ